MEELDVTVRLRLRRDDSLSTEAHAPIGAVEATVEALLRSRITGYDFGWVGVNWPGTDGTEPAYEEWAVLDVQVTEANADPV